MSSTMLGQLARLAKEVEKAKGQLKLIGLGPVLHDTFRISHFESLFAIYDDQGLRHESLSPVTRLGPLTKPPTVVAMNFPACP